MTCIAWDGKTLAADKRATYGQVVQVVTKVHRIGSLLVAGAGSMAFVSEMVEWVRAGRVLSDFPASQRTEDDWQPLLVIEPDLTVSVYEKTPWPIRWERPFCAIGSGKEYAMAALHLGKNAREAVAVACEFDPACGNGIDSISVDGSWFKDFA